MAEVNFTFVAIVEPSGGCTFYSVTNYGTSVSLSLNNLGGLERVADSSSSKPADNAPLQSYENTPLGQLVRDKARLGPYFLGRHG